MLNLDKIVCSKCRAPREKKEFGKDSTTARGISSWCKPCKKLWRTQHRKDNPEKYKMQDFKNDLKRHYGITVEVYNQMFDKQNGRCACCSRSSEEFRKGLHVDHDHATGQVRGLLCTQCNPGIGYFEESVERLEMAIKYLNKFKMLR